MSRDCFGHSETERPVIKQECKVEWPHMIDVDVAIDELLELNSEFEESPVNDILIQK